MYMSAFVWFSNSIGNPEYIIFALYS